jgi:hypothetical protein
MQPSTTGLIKAIVLTGLLAGGLWLVREYEWGYVPPPPAPPRFPPPPAPVTLIQVDHSEPWGQPLPARPQPNAY